MSEVFCNNCGHRNPLASNFCSSCGAPLDREPAESSTVTFQVEALPPQEEVSLDLSEVPAAGGMVVVKRGPNAGSRFSLDRPMISAGRHPESDIFLDDVTVSRRHAEILHGATGYEVRDVGSLNGTYLNRERIETAPLRNGDELQIGKFKLVFFEGGE